MHRPQRRRHSRFEIGLRSGNKDHVIGWDVRKEVLWSKARQGKEEKKYAQEEREGTGLS